MNASSLAQQHCVPCEGGTAPLSTVEEEKYQSAVPEWQIDRAYVHQLKRDFVFQDFKQAVNFVNQVSEISEAEGHHPDICIHAYKQVTISLFTHAIKGLSENDFIMAARINEISFSS